eukprot:5056935-Prymnesium_polylepis.1
MHVNSDVKYETNRNIPAARPARNAPESTTLARVASRPWMDRRSAVGPTIKGGLNLMEWRKHAEAYYA